MSDECRLDRLVADPKVTPALPLDLPDLERGEAVEVDWLDSCRNEGWQPEKDVLAWARKDATQVHHSVGYVILATPDVLVFCSSYADFDDGSYRSVNGAFSIPVRAILGVRRKEPRLVTSPVQP